MIGDWKNAKQLKKTNERHERQERFISMYAGVTEPLRFTASGAILVLDGKKRVDPMVAEPLSLPLFTFMYTVEYTNAPVFAQLECFP